MPPDRRIPASPHPGWNPKRTQPTAHNPLEIKDQHLAPQKKRRTMPPNAPQPYPHVCLPALPRIVRSVELVHSITNPRDRSRNQTALPRLLCRLRPPHRAQFFARPREPPHSTVHQRATEFAGTYSPPSTDSPRLALQYAEHGTLGRRCAGPARKMRSLSGTARRERVAVAMVRQGVVQVQVRNSDSPVTNGIQLVTLGCRHGPAPFRASRSKRF
jgi:hypothetical protein